MGLLDKLLGKRRDVPAWADFLDEAGYREFLALLENDLRERGLRHQLGDGFVLVHHPPGHQGSEPQRFGLINLAQACNLAPRTEWPAIIARHFRIMLQSVDGGMLDRLGESFEL